MALRLNQGADQNCELFQTVSLDRYRAIIGWGVRSDLQQPAGAWHFVVPGRMLVKTVSDPLARMDQRLAPERSDLNAPSDFAFHLTC